MGELTTEMTQELLSAVMDVLVAADMGDDYLKQHLKDNPRTVTPTFHKVLVTMVPMMFTGDGPDQVERREKSARVAGLVRRSIDVGVELAFAGY